MRMTVCISLASSAAGFDGSERGEAVVSLPFFGSVTSVSLVIEIGGRDSLRFLAAPAAVRHLTELGVTAVELLPVHAHIDDKALVDRGLTNYWGYNTIGFFAPEAKYSGSGDRGGQVNEFKTMVRNLHAAGIEVILDVVYNHTAEGNHLGPTLAFRGIDNIASYRLQTENPRFYLDFTGTGNTFNLLHPRTLQLVMDSLRYWVLEMHVDGFRFDLASTLARDANGVNKLHAFFEIIHQDPVLSQVKLIAEPWDVGEGGYQVGNFPVLWAEWNGKYRDAIRSFWKGDEGKIGEVAYRLTGSPDLYQHDGKRPYASINFVTSHDGFTLTDLVSYNEKHNEANGEKNHDGDNNNLSWNHGVEGPTEDPKINALRERQRRNFLTTLLISQGVPMLLGGDEFGRTQNGNNNAYCQDNELSWVHWDLDDEARSLQRANRIDEAKAKFAKVAANYEQSLLINPNHASTYLHLAALLVGPLKDPSRGVQLLADARRRFPGARSSRAPYRRRRSSSIVRTWF